MSRRREWSCSDAGARRLHQVCGTGLAVCSIHEMTFVCSCFWRLMSRRTSSLEKAWALAPLVRYTKVSLLEIHGGSCTCMHSVMSP